MLLRHGICCMDMGHVFLWEKNMSSCYDQNEARIILGNKLLDFVAHICCRIMACVVELDQKNEAGGRPENHIAGGLCDLFS